VRRVAILLRRCYSRKTVTASRAGCDERIRRLSDLRDEGYITARHTKRRTFLTNSSACALSPLFG
jgi:hypothetical protein